VQARRTDDAATGRAGDAEGVGDLEAILAIAAAGTGPARVEIALRVDALASVVDEAVLAAGVR